MYKYIISVLLLVASACSCNSTKPDSQTNEEVLCGGYGKETPLESEDSAVWNAAIASRPDLKDCKPLVVSRQVVAGMNYDFTCNDKNGKKITVKVFAPLPGEGSPKVTYPRKP